MYYLQIVQDPREDNKPVPRKIKLGGSKLALIL
jgi:hypothetical protein